MICRFGLLLVFSLAVGVSIGFGYAPIQEEKKQETERPKDVEKKAESAEGTEEAADEAVPDEFPPVDNMHHLMEHIFQPTYENLRAALAEEPENPADLRKIKGQALIMAECSVLVADRPPRDSTEEQIKEWRKISWEMRQSAKALYRSTRQYKQARKQWELMIDNCNKCHDVFENGRHQLEK